jgi:hypothetical protein
VWENNTSVQSACFASKLFSQIFDLLYEILAGGAILGNQVEPDAADLHPKGQVISHQGLPGIFEYSGLTSKKSWFSHLKQSTTERKLYAWISISP